MSIPANEEQAILSHVNGFIEMELAKLPGIAAHLIPGVAGMLAQAALATDMVQGELRKLADAGVDAAVHGAIHGFNGVQAAVLLFLTKHPALEELYKAFAPTLTGGQVLHLLADEAKALESLVLQGRRDEIRAALGLSPVSK